MKVYIRDGVVNFYKYKVSGLDQLSRPITLYAIDDAQRDKLLQKLTSTTVTNISPTPEQSSRAYQWQIENESRNFSTTELEKYILASISAPIDDEILQGTEVRIYSRINTSNKVSLDYNETENSLDINFNP